MDEVLFVDFTKGQYRFKAAVGDLVEMPNGLRGKVAEVQHPLGSVNCKAVRVYPFTNPVRRFFLTIFNRLWFTNDKINQLKFIERKGVRKNV